jgi:hypothetical protein
LNRSSLPSTVQAIFFSFASELTAPTFENFVALVTGWILCQGRRSISRVIQAAAGLTGGKHHSAFYRFLSRAQWAPDALGRVVFQLLLPFLGPEVVVVVDDTLSHRGGPHLWGAGMHHDASRSTYGRFTSAGRHIALAFGHCWVALAIWVPLPWNKQRGLAVPVLWRLYRAKKRCPEVDYRKKTQLAVELQKILVDWVPEQKKLHVVGDAEYSSNPLVRHLLSGVTFTGSMAMDAALYAKPGRYRGKGRPRTKGKRLPSPTKLAGSKRKWTRVNMQLYGQEVNLLVKTIECLWYTVAGTRVVRAVVTRDPRGRLEDRAYFSTDPALSVEQILTSYSRRWSLEVAFRDAKQIIGAEDPQNGWWRRKHGTRRPKKVPGPQPLANRGRGAIERTLPLAFTAYALVVVWYLRHGCWDGDVARAKKAAPWYRHKREPSFTDMLSALRRELWAVQLSSTSAIKRAGLKLASVRRLLPGWLLAS